MPEAQLQEIERRLNATIHELVFAMAHAGDGNFDDACTCLATAQGTIEAVAEELNAAELGKPVDA